MKRGAFAFAAGILAAVVSAVAFVAVASATTIPLPAPNLYQPTVFGDAQVYSLELLNLIQSNNKLSTKGQFKVASGEGQIKDLIVIGTGAKGQSSKNTSLVSPAGDLTASWEVSIAALITYLTDPTTGQQFNLVFVADSNQEGNDAGQTIGGCFDVTTVAGDGAGCAAMGLTEDYVENAGDFCVSAATGEAYAPPCAAGDFGLVSNNLGSNTAEFAVVFPLLNTVSHLQALLAGAVNLSVELRFNNTDGYDTFWLCDRCTAGGTIAPPPVLAATSLLLLGSGMLGVGTLAWRRARRQA